MVKIEVENRATFENLIDEGDMGITQALVETILQNLKGRKRFIPSLSVSLLEEGIIMDITVDRNDFIFVLETNLPKYEKHEMFEKCAEIVKGIAFLKEKIKK